LIVPDVNVLILAFRRELPGHAECATWLRRVLDSDESVGLNDGVLSGVLRIATNPRIFEVPTPIDRALEYVEVLRGRPNSVWVTPGERHWTIFTRLCKEVEAKGRVVPDAYFAALAMEWGADFVTLDRGFGRFPGLRWRHPLDAAA
jgi:toxin-antitoxin system PIN domain toxin